MNFDVQAGQQSFIRVFILLGKTPYQTRAIETNGMCKSCAEEFNVSPVQTFYSETFNSE